MPNPRYSTATHLRGALYAYLAPRLAMDAQMPDLGPVVQDVTRRNFHDKRNQIAARLRHATHGRIAYDADLSDILDLLDALEEGYAGEEMEEGEDRRRARDVDPNGFGNGAWRVVAVVVAGPRGAAKAPLRSTTTPRWTALILTNGAPTMGKIKRKSTNHGKRLTKRNAAASRSPVVPVASPSTTALR
jgi:hypothetical protein